jgi:MoxR-like ATPase
VEAGQAGQAGQAGPPAVIALIQRMVDSVSRVILGKEDRIKIAVATLLARGHLLMEDVPGVGKTTLSRALAQSVHCEFKRIQATSDLLPSDIIGISIYDHARGTFEFKPGPIFTSFLLVDEINRATPRTQSSLLQAMSEFAVTVDQRTHALPPLFFVVATQNPVEQIGTYLLPESQLDRFAVRISLGYPPLASEEKMIYDHMHAHPLERVEPVCTQEDVLVAQKLVREIRIDPRVTRYVMKIVERTRNRDELAAGVSPRGVLSLVRLAQAYALLSGRDYVAPDDVKVLVPPAFAHRVIYRGGFRTNLDEEYALMRTILSEVEVP